VECLREGTIRVSDDRRKLAPPRAGLFLTGDRMNSGFLRDPRQWRFRAEQMRVDAYLIGDPAKRCSMLDTADQYERVGKFIEEQQLDLLKQPAAPTTHERPH
jgi:hypothetical protein